MNGSHNNNFRFLSGRQSLLLFLAVSVCFSMIYMIVPLSAASDNVTISGLAVDADTGSPIPNIKIAVDTARDTLYKRDSKIEAAMGPGITVTDSQGRFELTGISTGRRVIAAFPASARGSLFATSLPLKANAGTVISNLLLRIHMPASIEGTVYYELGRPAKDVRVLLVTPEMSYGITRYFIRAVSRTQADGSYNFNEIRSDLPWLVMADRISQIITSDMPKDPAPRPEVSQATFYPNVTDPAASTIIELLSGEKRNGVDITLRSAHSYCVDGSVSGADVKLPAEIHLALVEPSYGSGVSGGFWGPSPKGITRNDGSFRICGLGPGEYKLTSFTRHVNGANAECFGSAIIRIYDRDVHEIQVDLAPPFRILGETKWTEARPSREMGRPLQISLLPAGRSPWVTESKPTLSGVPDSFELPFVFRDTYKIKVGPLPRGFFVDEMQFGSKAARGASIEVDTGTETGPLEISIGHGAATMLVRAVDDRNRPSSGYFVYLVPRGANDLRTISEETIIGQCDQEGEHLFDREVPPGAYFVIATMRRPRMDAEFWLYLWSLRRRANEVIVAVNGNIRQEVKVVE